MFLLCLFLHLAASTAAAVIFEDCVQPLVAWSLKCWPRSPFAQARLSARLEKLLTEKKDFWKNIATLIQTIPEQALMSLGSAYDLEEVSIEGCDMRLPCFVTLGEDVPVEIKFHAGFVSSKLDQEVVININFISLRTNVTPEACATVDCPVRTDGATSFNSVMSVPTNMALNQRGYLRWRVYNENGRLVLCYAVLVQTQRPRQKLSRQALAEAKTYQHLDEPPASAPSDMTNIHATDMSSLDQIVKRYFKRDSIASSGDVGNNQRN